MQRHWIDQINYVAPVGQRKSICARGAANI